jgi:hypothetical protein
MLKDDLFDEFNMKETLDSEATTNLTHIATIFLLKHFCGNILTKTKLPKVKTISFLFSYYE